MDRTRCRQNRRHDANSRRRSKRAASPRTRIAFDGSIHDEGYTLLEEWPVWVVFVSERGKRIEEQLCYSEAEGCARFYDWLVSDQALRVQR